jgi:GDP-L-fucose synthase
MNENNFWRNKHVVVTGGAGFLGSHVVAKLRERGAARIIVPRSRDCDLRRAECVARLLDEAVTGASGSDVLVIHAAARVGGIGANMREPATFFHDNLMMGVQLLHEAWHRGVAKFVTIGTVCAYPKLAPIPFREEGLWDGYPEETNAPYGLAKKMLLVQGGAYREQHGFNSIHLMPTNLYGPGDNFDEGTSHVIPALIRRCAEARQRKLDHIVAWGTGRATREYMYVEDAAEAIVLASERYDRSEPLNVCGDAAEVSMRDLVTLIRSLTGFEGEVEWDASRPDGQPRRKLDASRMKAELGFEATTDFETGLRRTIEWYERR